MQNLKMGMKLALAFGFLIMLSVILGGMAIGIMRMVQSNSILLADAYIPEVQISNELERRALLIMDNMDLYSLNGKTEVLNTAKKDLANLKSNCSGRHRLIPPANEQ